MYFCLNFEAQSNRTRVSAKRILRFWQTRSRAILNGSKGYCQVLKVHFDLKKNLEIFKNTDNSPKYEILTSFFNLVFTDTVGHGRDYPSMKAGVKLDRFKNIWCSRQLPTRVGRRKNPFFEDKLRNYDVTWWFIVKTDTTTEFSVVDLVEIESYSPISSKFE